MLASSGVADVVSMTYASSFTPPICEIDRSGVLSCGGNAESTLAGVVAVSAGGSHTCAINATNELHCWGDGIYGQLGLGESGSPQNTPQHVAGLTSGVVAVSAGGSHTCAIDQEGKLFCWGNGMYGQLGLGESNSQYTPQHVAGLTSGVVAVSAGGSHTCAIDREGKLYCWGAGVSAQLGLGESNSQGLAAPQEDTPQHVAGLTSALVAVSAGEYHTCAIDEGGKLYCWGEGVQSRPVPLRGVLPASSPEPCAVGQFYDRAKKGCSSCPMEQGSLCGYLFSASDEHAQCPEGFYCPSSSQAIPCETAGDYCPPGITAAENCPRGSYCPTTVTRILCPAGFYCSGLGLTHVTGKCKQGEYCPVGSTEPALCPSGHHCPSPGGTPVPCGGSATSCESPTRIDALISAEMVIRTDGTVVDLTKVSDRWNGYASDSSRAGLVYGASEGGNSVNSLLRVTRIVRSVNGEDCFQVASGAWRCWGGNSEGQFGLGHKDIVNRCPYYDFTDCDPAEIDLGGGRKIVDLVLRGGTACAVDDQGSVHCSGNNAYGQLGTGATQPSKVSTWQTVDLKGRKAARVFTNERGTNIFLCALLDDGMSIVCWGINSGNSSPNEGKPFAITGVQDEVSDVLDPRNGLVLFMNGSLARLEYGGYYSFRAIYPLPDGVIRSYAYDGSSDSASELQSENSMSSGTICAASEDGRLQCVSSNENGQAGTGNYDRVREWTTVSLAGAAEDVRCVDVVIGYVSNNNMGDSSVVCALGDNGKVYCWGGSDWQNAIPTEMTIPGGYGSYSVSSSVCPAGSYSDQVNCVPCSAGTLCYHGSLEERSARRETTARTRTHSSRARLESIAWRVSQRKATGAKQDIIARIRRKISSARVELIVRRAARRRNPVPQATSAPPPLRYRLASRGGTVRRDPPTGTRCAPRERSARPLRQSRSVPQDITASRAR